MLVFSRGIRQSFVITAGNGEQITVHYMELRGRIVRLGIDAPATVTIHRSEVWEKPQHRAALDARLRDRVAAAMRQKEADEAEADRAQRQMSEEQHEREWQQWHEQQRNNGHVVARFAGAGPLVPNDT